MAAPHLAAAGLDTIVAARMPDGVAVILVSDGTIVYTNASWDRMFGYDAGELTGRHISEVNAPVEQTPNERAREITDALERDGRWIGTVHNVRKDGSLAWSEAEVVETEHPELGAVWITVQREITE